MASVLVMFRAVCLLVCAATCALSQRISFESASGDGIGSACETPDNKSGRCSLLMSCPSLQIHLRNRNFDFLRKSQKVCGSRDRTLLLCCAASAGISAGGDTSRIKTPFRSPRDCGRSKFSPPRVVGGETVETIKNFPWMTALKYEPKSGTPDYRCGGSVLNDRWVLTAAHCITSAGPRFATVRDVFLNSKEKDDFDHPPEDVEVEQVFKHSRFTRLTRGALVNDIALLKLKTRITFSEFVRPICVNSKVRLTSEFESIEKVYVAGWGFTSFDGEQSLQMQWARVGVFPHQQCIENYGRTGVQLSEESQLCANGNDTTQEGCDELNASELCRGGKDTCSGDSGGPLMEQRTVFNQERFYAIGVVSYGTGCGHPDYPGIYTRVDHYLGWIGTTVEDN